MGRVATRTLTFTMVRFSKIVELLEQKWTMKCPIREQTPLYTHSKNYAWKKKRNRRKNGEIIIEATISDRKLSSCQNHHIIGQRWKWSKNKNTEEMCQKTGLNKKNQPFTSQTNKRTHTKSPPLYYKIKGDRATYPKKSYKST